MTLRYNENAATRVERLSTLARLVALEYRLKSLRYARQILELQKEDNEMLAIELMIEECIGRGRKQERRTPRQRSQARRKAGFRS
jgi:hypothetical protein